jgi:hypothetical protein
MIDGNKITIAFADFVNQLKAKALCALKSAV